MPGSLADSTQQSNAACLPRTRQDVVLTRTCRLQGGPVRRIGNHDRAFGPSIARRSLTIGVSRNSNPWPTPPRAAASCPILTAFRRRNGSADLWVECLCHMGAQPSTSTLDVCTYGRLGLRGVRLWNRGSEPAAMLSVPIPRTSSNRLTASAGGQDDAGEAGDETKG
jgi:hypothetical protein